MYGHQNFKKRYDFSCVKSQYYPFGFEIGLGERQTWIIFSFGVQSGSNNLSGEMLDHFSIILWAINKFR